MADRKKGAARGGVPGQRTGLEETVLGSGLEEPVLSLVSAKHRLFTAVLGQRLSAPETPLPLVDRHHRCQSHVLQPRAGGHLCAPHSVPHPCDWLKQVR